MNTLDLTRKLGLNKINTFGQYVKYYDKVILASLNNTYYIYDPFYKIISSVPESLNEETKSKIRGNTLYYPWPHYPSCYAVKPNRLLIG